jgi:hypothetical protein
MSGVSINQVLIVFPFTPLEVEFYREGNAEERLAKLGGVADRLRPFGRRGGRVLRLDGILRRWPDHGDGLTIVGDEATLAFGGVADELRQVRFGWRIPKVFIVLLLRTEVMLR